MKLVVEEAESAALRELLMVEREQIASAIAEVEVIRAARRASAGLESRARAVLASVTVLELAEHVRAGAALLEPMTLRTLDAIHLATALALGSELRALVTYDRRLADAADAVGVSVVTPA